MVTMTSASSALAKWASRLSRVSRAMPSSARLGAGRFRERRHAQVIGGDDLAGAGRLPRRHQLVAGREDGDARAAAHGERAVAHGGGQRDLAGPEAAAGGEQRLALAEIEAAAADVARVDACPRGR